MDAGIARDVLTAGAGVATGMLSAAFGVGGAVISTPALRALGVSATTAIGTTLPAILPSALAGSRRYAREQLIDWPVVAATVPAGIGAAVAGAVAAHHIPGEGHWLMMLTAVLLALTARRSARGADLADDDDPRPEPSRWVFAAVGAVAGALSGLLGVGGGIATVPGFTEFGHLRLKRAIATSLVCVGCFAVPGTITHAALGGIDWRYAALLTLGVIPGARLGASLAMRATDRRLRLTVAAFLGVIAAAYLLSEIAAVAS